MTTKIDFKKKYKELYSASAKTPSIVEVPPLQYLMVDGKGDPNSEPWFAACTGALYSLSYTIKFGFKKGEQAGAFPDYAVPPLQGLWWAKDMIFDMNDKSGWHWRLMILQPDFVTQEHLEQARAVQRKKNPSEALEQVRLETYDEGKCVQIMHIGPYAAEEPTIRHMHKYAHDNGYALRGLHHEIYLGDPRKSAPEKLRPSSASRWSE